jgi:hypothetical protein
MIKRVKMDVLERSVKEAGLDMNYINGLYDFRSKFSEVRNIFAEFKDTYYEACTSGNLYQAAQIVRKAALFMFETLVPKDLNITLHVENNKNLYDKAELLCSPDDIQTFVIRLYGGSQCVQFVFSRRVNGLDLPLIEGDLDSHAISTIKKYLSNNRKKVIKNKNAVAKFDDNAKKLTATYLDKA